MSYIKFLLILLVIATSCARPPQQAANTLHTLAAENATLRAYNAELLAYEDTLRAHYRELEGHVLGLLRQIADLNEQLSEKVSRSDVDLVVARTTAGTYQELCIGLIKKLDKVYREHDRCEEAEALLELLRVVEEAFAETSKLLESNINPKETE